MALAALQDEEFLYFPVPRRWAPDMYSWIAQREQVESRTPTAPTATQPEAEAPVDLPVLIERMYRDSQPAHQKLMTFLAAHPDEWFYTSELADALELPHGNKSLAGMLGAFGRRAAHRYGGRTPWISEWDASRYESRHTMTQEVADVINGLAKD